MRWLLAFLLFMTPATAFADWPQFRGPHGDGVAEATHLATTWSATENIAWKTEIPGRGWSSPIVIGRSIWLTTAEQTALSADQAKEKLANSADLSQLQTHAEITLWLLEVHADTGRILRRIELFTVKHPEPIHGNNSYATPTPAGDGRHVFCHFGTFGTACVDAQTGDIVWKASHSAKFITGPASSPALWNDLLILTCDGADEQYLIALSKTTGKPVWKTPRPPIETSDEIMRRAFSTPLSISHAGREQLVSPGARWTASYDPATGKELWRVDGGKCYSTVPRPVFADGLVYICTGFTKPELWAIRPDGAGDVTETHVAWKHDKQVPEIASPILAGGRIYFVSSQGVVTALDAKTGRQSWQQRLGGNFSASPLFAGGKLYFTSQEGITTVLAPGEKYQELAKNELFGQTLASLAINGHSLVVRTDGVLYCIRKNDFPLNDQSSPAR